MKQSQNKNIFSAAISAQFCNLVDSFKREKAIEMIRLSGLLCWGYGDLSYENRKAIRVDNLPHCIAVLASSLN